VPRFPRWSGNFVVDRSEPILKVLEREGCDGGLSAELAGRGMRRSDRPTLLQEQRVAELTKSLQDKFDGIMEA